jgi:2,3-dihydroxy-p-cumate/2,3-dihydroxybenzoate 3,4-dioxygenase
MIRYYKLGYVALDVTDLARSRNFYEHILGLQFVDTGEQGELYFRCSADHHNIVLYQSEQAGVRRIGWELEGERALDDLADHLAPLGVPVQALSDEACMKLHQGRTYRIKDPCLGVTHEFYSTIFQHGDAYRPTVAQIQRLGHVVIRVPDAERAVKQCTDILNFRVSDCIEGGITFMRCFPNPLHHSFAIAQEPIPGLHHLNFMVTEIDDIGKALTRLKKNDVPIVFGPGRHPTSTSIFLYFLDPDGLTMEYSFGMEEFPAENPRKYRRFEAKPSSGDSWGNVPDPRFGKTGAISTS